MLHQQRVHDVEHGADDEQAGKEPAHPPALGPRLESHMSYNGKADPEGSGAANHVDFVSVPHKN